MIETKLERAGTAATIGFFDGVHRGHQALLQRTVEWATIHGVASVALTFDVHPREVLQNTGPLRYLTLLPQKKALLLAEGLDEVVVLPFNRDLAILTGEEFVRRFLQTQLQVRHLVVGADFAFGRKRAWDTVALRRLGTQYGFTVEVVPEIEDNRRPLRSTAIRQALEAGQVQVAAHLLGRPFSLLGNVVEGQRLGRTLGFPTANLQLDPRQFYPGNGVYAVSVTVGRESWKGVLNIGMRPTVGGQKRTLEVHLLDFQGNLYGREITVEFWDHLRPEQKFSDIQELRTAIARDVARAREMTEPPGPR